MEHTIGEFFVEEEASNVTGFAIVDTDESEGYRIAEKWQRPSGDAKWLTYWIPESNLLERRDNGKCYPSRRLSKKQLQGVGNLAEVEVSA